MAWPGLVLVFQRSAKPADIYGVAVTGTFILDMILFFAVARYIWLFKIVHVALRTVKPRHPERAGGADASPQAGLLLRNLGLEPASYFVSRVTTTPKTGRRSGAGASACSSRWRATPPGPSSISGRP